MTRETKALRKTRANAILTEIAARGRHFFRNAKTGEIARFEFNASGRLRFRDEFTNKLIDVSVERRWDGFSGGGTMQSLVSALGKYVSKGEKVDRRHFGPWRDWKCNGDVWGYGFEEMEDLRAAISDNPCLQDATPRPTAEPIQPMSA